MSEIKRIDPRRPYLVTPAGVRRIVLGDASGSRSHGGEMSVIGQAQTKPRRTQQTPQAWHMAIAHSWRGRLDEHAREAIAAAAILAAPETGVIVVVLGNLHDDLGEFGADKIAVLEKFDASRFQPELELAAVSALIETFKPVHVFMPDNAGGDGDLGRRLIAEHLDFAATHVSEINATRIAVAWKESREHTVAPLLRFILLDPGTIDTSLPYVGAGKVLEPSEVPDLAIAKSSLRDLGIETLEASNIALEEADFIVSAGNGVHNIQTLEALAGLFGAAVGASRVAVDDGKFAHDKQIGASGKTVTASTYVAVGISGAVQHLQGIKDCRHVIAINRDAGAPIVKRADLTIIGDAEEVMQALITRVSQARNQREVPEVT